MFLKQGQRSGIDQRVSTDLYSDIVATVFALFADRL
jgi:hypothetical protein